ncbi:MAG: autotransporter outer membrane beta-barrel domain-containing protein [Pontiella sp.]
MKFKRNAAISSLIILATGASTQHIFANSLDNSFDSSITNYISSDTNYDSEIYIGYFKADNTLIITDGAVLTAEEVILGVSDNSTNNNLSVIGDALLIAGNSDTDGLTTGGIVVGDAGGNPGISINNSSTMNAEFLYIGYGTNDTGLVSISDKGSALNIAQDAYVGYNGSNNVVDIESGAALNIEGDLFVGLNNTNNSINVSGSLFVNTTSNILVTTNNTIVINSGGAIQFGGDVESSTVEDLGIELKSGSILEVGGTLTLKSIDDGLNVVLNDDLSDHTAQWQSSSVTVIGRNTSNNSLTFTNGATGLASSIIQVGQESGADYNKLIVGGTGTTFRAQQTISIGNSGSNNEFSITNGGLVYAEQDLIIGSSADGSGNQVNVQSNGILKVSADIIAGDNGGSSEFNIHYGQVSVSNDFFLGNNSANNDYDQIGGTNTVTGQFLIGNTEDASGSTGSVSDDIIETSGNLALIGTNAVLNIGQDLTVGNEGSGSILTIRDGGIVNVDGDAVIGETAGDNYIYLQRDSNTQFNVSGDLIVGKEGGSNRFAIYGGTATIDGDFFLGATTNLHDIKNFVHLETSNAVLIANTVHIGASNSLNTLDLADGAQLLTTHLFVGAYEGVSNNTVTVDGENSIITVDENLVIGSTTGSNNTITVQNGGTLEVAQANIEIGSTNAFLTVADGGILKTLGWDFTAQTNLATNIVFESGSTLHIQSALVGTNMAENMSFILDGTNASWDSITNLYVGFETSNNSLTLTNGVSLTTATNLYIGYNSEGNTVTVGGNETILTVGADLYIGSEEDDSAYNTLSVLDGATVNVEGDAYLFHRGILEIDSKSSSVTVTGDYTQDEWSTLHIGISSNQVSPSLTVGGTAEFASRTDIEDNPIIYIHDEGLAKSNEITIVQAGSITVDGETASSGSIAANIHTNLLLDFNISISNDYANQLVYIVLNDFNENSIGTAGDLTGQTLDVSEEIDLLADNGDTNALAMIKIFESMTASEISTTMDNLYDEKISSIPANNIINMGIQSVSEQLTMRADNTRARARAASTTPAGVDGPHAIDQKFQGWISAFNTWGDLNADDGFDGYEANISGFMVGADLSVAKNILLGLAGGSSSATVDQDAGSTSDIDSIYAAIYASIVTDNWFGDVEFIYANSSIDSRLDPNVDTTAEYDANNIAFMLGGGKEFIGQYFTITPYASLLGNIYSQDSYTEQSSSVGRNVDSFSNFNLQSSLGGSAAMYLGLGKVTFKPEVSLTWLHEWLGEEEEIDYQLIGGTDSYTMQLQAPKKDIIKLGIGSSAKLGEYLELRADLDTRFGSNYRDYTLRGSIRYQF